MTIMKCPHLKKWLLHSCKAKETLYFPSAFQLEEYCKRKEHRKCPFLAINIPQRNVEQSIHLTESQI